MTSFKGDQGFTDLIREGGVSKADARIQAIGAVDEAWAALGFARSLVKNSNHQAVLLQLQKDLYILMAQLAGTSQSPQDIKLIDSSKVDWLDFQITALENSVVMPDHFIISGDTVAGGALALARTIVRRAERQVVAMSNLVENFDKVLIKYLNRLSSVCFMLELAEYASPEASKSSDKL